MTAKPESALWFPRWAEVLARLPLPPLRRQHHRQAILRYLGYCKATRPCATVAAMNDDEPVPIPIDGVLDLHTFRPRDVKELVLDYLAECQRHGIREVRIIHGKGIGNLRRTVHALLERHPEVVSFTLDHPQYGGWGATLVRLKDPATEPPA